MIISVQTEGHKLDANRWTLAEDCAHWLSTEDIEAGRRELRERIERLQKWFLKKRLAWRRTVLGLTVFFVCSVGWSGLLCYIVGVRQSVVALGITIFALCSLPVAKNFPRFVQQLPIKWSRRAPFNDEKLEKLREYLDTLADSERIVTTIGHREIERDILRKDWALLYLTTTAKLHALPILTGVDITLESYAEGLFVERPLLPPAISETPKITSVNVYVDQRTSNMTVVQNVEINLVRTYYHFITRLRKTFDEAQASVEVPTPDQKLGRKRPVRWPCEFEDADYEIRLFKFKETPIPGLARIEPDEIEKYAIVIDGARRHWQKNSGTSIEKLAVMLGDIVEKATGCHAGLNKTHSVAWIRSVIGGTGEYAFVRTSFSAIQIDPSEFKYIQYQLLLE